MTNTSLTLIAGLLDRSGSMTTSKEATEDGWRELINEQSKVPGRVLVTLAQFDDRYDRLYSNLPINQLPNFVLEPRGMTAMLDAIGKFITEIGEHLANIPEDDRPGTVICIIMTDGAENASQDWTYASIKKLITQQREQYNWRFIFLGANIDAVKVGASMGISRGDSITYNSHDGVANRAVYASASASMENTRSGLLDAFTEDDRDEALGKGTGKKKASATSKPGK